MYPELRYMMYPRTADSWCKFQADQINGTNTYVDKPGIPNVISEEIRPVFISLSDDDLLKRCLHGKTQNANESINGMIWKRCPKDVFVSKETIEMAVASAVIGFNEGAKGMLNR